MILVKSCNFLLHLLIILHLFVHQIGEAALFSPTGRQDLTDEERLNDVIFRDYDASFRPVYNASEAVDIVFGLTLINISKMDELSQILELTVWLEISWKDKRLTWTPSDFSGLSLVLLPTKILWTPDIVLYNSADEFRVSGDIRAMVYSTGKVFVGPYVKLRSTCILDLTLYPFDDQVCRLVFGSWSYDTSQLVLVPTGLKPVLTQYVESAVWELLDTRIDQRTQIYSCCKHPFSVVIISIKIRRRFLFNYLLNIFIPTIWLIVLTLLSFWLDPASGEKITLGVTILVTFTLYQLLVAQNTPRTSDFVPLISLFLETSYGTTAVVVGLQVFILNLYGLSPILIAVPNWLRVLVFNCIAPCLCLDVDIHGKKRRRDSSKKKGHQHHHHKTSSLKNKQAKSSSSKKSTATNDSSNSLLEQANNNKKPPNSSLIIRYNDTVNGTIIYDQEQVMDFYDDDDDDVNNINNENDYNNDEKMATLPCVEDNSSNNSESSESQAKSEKKKSEHIYMGIEEIIEGLQPKSHQKFLQRDYTTHYQTLPTPRIGNKLAEHGGSLTLRCRGQPQPSSSVIYSNGDNNNNEDGDRSPLISATTNKELVLYSNVTLKNNVKFYCNTPPPSPSSAARHSYQRIASDNTVITRQPKPGETRPRRSYSRRPKTGRSRFEDELLRRLLWSVGFMVKREQSAKMTENVVAEWRMISFVLDRLAFWIFAVFTLFFIVLFLVALPMGEHALHEHNRSLFVDPKSMQAV